MTREGLSDFLRAIEHNASLRRKLKECSSNDSLLKLAKDYGFKVELYDLQNESEANKIESWFKLSQIHPIRKPYN